MDLVPTIPNQELVAEELEVEVIATHREPVTLITILSTAEVGLIIHLLMTKEYGELGRDINQLVKEQETLTI